MKVTCSKCGTEYNFDDAKVTEEGVKVKCTRCENVFRVRRKHFVLTEPMQVTDNAIAAPEPEPEPSQPSQPSLPGSLPGERKWLIRKVTGETLDFNEMTTLQRWIVERSVDRDDEISHNGVKWKKLGAIPELAPFFNVVGGVAEPDSPTNPEGQALTTSLLTRESGSARKANPNGPARGSTMVVRLMLLLIALGGFVFWSMFTEDGRAKMDYTGDWAGIMFARLVGREAAAASPTPTAVVIATPTLAPVTSVATPTAIVVDPTPVVPSPSPVATKVAARPPSVDQLLQKGYEAYSRGRYREAIVKYQAAVNADPDNSEAYALLGLAYLDSGQDDLAESTLEASIRLNPRFADAHRYLGQLFAKRGDKGRAVKSFNTYLDLRPNGPTSDEVRRRVASLEGP